MFVKRFKYPNNCFIIFCLLFIIIIIIEGICAHPAEPKLRNSLEEELLKELLLEQEFEEEEDQLDGFEYVTESKDNFRIGCSGRFRQGAYATGGESGTFANSIKELVSLFIKDLDGFREIQELKYVKAKYRNGSGSLLERKVYLGEFPEQCFEPLFRIEIQREDYDSEFCLRGPMGPPGKAGKPGLPGLPGRDGRPGKPGLPGKDGLPGKHGQVGDPGEPGEDGEDGEVGEVGDEGDVGEIGRPGVDGEDGTPGAPGLLF